MDKPLKEHFEVDTNGGKMLRTFDYIEALEKYIANPPNDRRRLLAKKLMYWKQRSDLAEDYINKSPCDPDIYPDQYKAYVEWQEIKKEKPPEV